MRFIFLFSLSTILLTQTLLVFGQVVVRPIDNLVLRKLPISRQNRFGQTGVRLPRGTRMVAPAKFRQMHKKGKIKLVTPAILRRQQQAATNFSLKKHKENKKVVGRHLRLNRIKKQIKKPVRVKPVGDNYIHTIRDNYGRKKEVMTMGERFVYKELAASLKNFRTKKNQLNIYSHIYSKLPKKYLKIARLPNPRNVRNYNAAKLIQLNKKIAVSVKDIIGYLPRIIKPVGWRDCHNEIGAAPIRSLVGDQSEGNCAHNSDGIFENVNYPLKWYTTCVKNQGKRGTCVAFAATAATEILYAVRKSKWANLSEQALYNRAKMSWYPSTYGDGLSTTGILNDLVSRNYIFSYEHQWDYNPSLNRINDKVNRVYTRSCDNYTDEHCSDTNHQGDFLCVNINSDVYCGYNANTSTSGSYRVKSVSIFMDQYDIDLSMALAHLATVLKIPVVLSLPVTPSFDGANSAGYASYSSSNETSRGGHAVTVVGVVANSQLPAGVPHAAGGSYFVVKNSWGKCWKDAGYIYLPYNWVKNYATSLSVVNGIY